MVVIPHSSYMATAAVFLAILHIVHVNNNYGSTPFISDR